MVMQLTHHFCGMVSPSFGTQVFEALPFRDTPYTGYILPKTNLSTF